MTSPPASTDDLLVDAASVAACKQWIRDCRDQIGCRRALIVTSPSTGMGITTMIRLACAEEGAEPVCVSTNIPKLKVFLADVAASATTVEGRSKILIIDPLDAVLAEPSGAADIAEYCKAGSRIPMIFAGMRMRSSVAKLHDCVHPKLYEKTVLAVPPIDTAAALALLRTAAASVGSTVPIEPLWKGDIRNALAAVTLDVSNAAKDDVCDGVDAVRRALCDDSLTIRDAIRMHEGDVSMITSGTHENYLRTGQSIDTCCAMSETYSLADIMEERMYQTQRWELGDVQIAVAAGGPVAYLDKAASQRTHNLDLSKFGTIWSRNNNQRTKEKAFRAIRDALMERGMGGAARIDGIATLRHIILASVSSGRLDDAAARLGDLPNEMVLAIMRLWKCGYTQAHHGHIKRKRAL